MEKEEKQSKKITISIKAQLKSEDRFVLRRVRAFYRYLLCCCFYRSFDILSPLPIVQTKHFNHPHPYIEIATAISETVTVNTIQQQLFNLFSRPGFHNNLVHRFNTHRTIVTHTIFLRSDAALE